MEATIGTRTCEAQALRLYTGGTGENFACGNMYHEEIAQLTARIVEVERPEKIILFGSYASGTATESSDIDLLVISRSTLPRREREVRLTRRLFGSGVPYDLLVLTPEEMEERIDSPSYAARSSSTPRAGNIETTSRWSINWTSFSGRLAKP